MTGIDLTEYPYRTSDPIILEQAIEMALQDAEFAKEAKNYEASTAHMKRAFELQCRLTKLERRIACEEFVAEMAKRLGAA